MVIKAHDEMVLGRAIEASIGLPDTIVYVNRFNGILTVSYHRTGYTILELCNGKVIGGTYYDNQA